MSQNVHLEILSRDEARHEPGPESPRPTVVMGKASELADSLTWLPNATSSTILTDRVEIVTEHLKPIFAKLDGQLEGTISDDFRWLYDSASLIYAELRNTSKTLELQENLPHVRTATGEVIPRVLAVAEAFWDIVSFQFSEQELSQFVETLQESVVLDLRELWALAPALELVLIEEIAERGARLIAAPQSLQGVASCVRSLRELTQFTWKNVVEPLVVFERILRKDPAGCYAAMDFESRDLYRNQLAKIARHSEHNELEVAQEVLALAREANNRKFSDPRVRLRESHVGYYIVDRGTALLYQRIGFKPPIAQKIQLWLRAHAEQAFVLGIEVLTFAVLLFAVANLSYSFGLVLFSMLLLLLPSSQSAVQVVNFLVTSILPPQILPKLDLSEAIPDDCVTMVAVPSLLLNEQQVRNLVQNLEVRFLGNHDPNIHFALLTDLPDAREATREDSPLIALCSDLIRELNAKYANQHMGSFFLFHRHRVFNPRERAWMGWERKRGKLLDLNKLLRGQYDSFPVKLGDLSILPRVRFVITLDSDTELPRGTAHRMIGALSHPLNQAVIDPERNIVVAGYGILQPRVGISVESTARSRLASIYAGETGFDIYTRAVSDAYQDLFGEGIFTGKGIYEVDVIQRVLDRRFPRNALLSHDLIEGSYARAGLVSDIDVIEDYPSHYSAYNRRKHRWLRGDWQIAGWLFPYVPDESGIHVENPISLISRWKIFDNLRRSLVEPATFTMLVLGWLYLGSPWYWTLTTICILFIPAWFELCLHLLRSIWNRNSLAASDAVTAFYAASINVLFTLIFLAHQTLLAVDAVARALVRRIFTHRRLLEWETAAEAEAGVRTRGPVDIYLTWTPVLSGALALLVWLVRPSALWTSLPILSLWALSPLASRWLNRPSVAARKKASPKEVAFLRRTALYTWRYFAEFSTAEHHWMVPDNVQEQPPAIAARVSPTNLGLLLNVRQVACEFGYLTAPEFAQRTLQTLGVMSALPKHRGHLLNWYDTRSLEPLSPLFVSSVDSGNLFASLWTLKHGGLERLRQPILQPCLCKGLIDCLRVLVGARALPRKQLAQLERQAETGYWLEAIFNLSEAALERAANSGKSKFAADAKWFANEAKSRVQSIKQTVHDYAPWCSPEFNVLRHDPVLGLQLMDNMQLEQLPEFILKLVARLDAALATADRETWPLYERLRRRMSGAQANVEALIKDLRTIADQAGHLADKMDFTFLLNRRRKLVSVGFDVDSNELHQACYDLLCTESRTAIFAGIAKDDIPEESWFLLGRAHTLDCGHPVLLSWTGTLFEYLMPSLWMRSFSNTLLERSRVAAVRSQQAYAARRGVPWGISESAYCKLDDGGNYQYHAFGLPQLAMRKPGINALVISPYSTFLAMNVDPDGAIENLTRMAAMKWLGSYGFYEAADYSSVHRRFGASRYQVVRCWMAHHQGMSLLALANFLCDNVVQKWFHSERRVQATELLLHEKPVAHVRREDIPVRLAAA